MSIQILVLLGHYFLLIYVMWTLAFVLLVLNSTAELQNLNNIIDTQVREKNISHTNFVTYLKRGKKPHGKWFCLISFVGVLILKL